ncbi:MAG: hypothetical protein WCR07_11165 [Verrucomicrobiota bacterium]|jgi:hypothetical protein
MTRTFSRKTTGALSALRARDAGHGTKRVLGEDPSTSTAPTASFGTTHPIFAFSRLVFGRSTTSPCMTIPWRHLSKREAN